MTSRVDFPTSQQVKKCPISEADRARASEGFRAAVKQLEPYWAELDKNVTVKTTPEEQRDLARRVVAWRRECSRATREDFEARTAAARKRLEKKGFFAFLANSWKRLILTCNRNDAAGC